MFRADGTLWRRTFTTITVNGKVTDQTPHVQVVAYKVVDGHHIILESGKTEHRMRVLLIGDELTCYQQASGERQ